MNEPLSGGPIRLARWLEVLFLLLLPPLAFWGLNYRLTYQMDSLDPYFYTGYINNAEDLLQRFQLLYYSVRFGLILPARLLTSALGAEPGYFAFRYLLALTAGVPLYLFAKRIFNRPVAILAYVTLIVSPWFARTVLWDHPDAAAVPYLLAVMCLLLLDRRPSWARDGVAGICASMAVNCNVFTVAILGIFGALYLALSLVYGSSLRTLLQRGIRFAAGFVLVLVGGCSYYWHVFGSPRNIFKPSFDVAMGLQSGGMLAYRTPGAAWLLQATQVMVPVLLALCCLVAVVRRGMRFETAVCTASGSAVIAFFFVHQFLLNGDTLQLSYYFSYALPTTLLMLVCLWQAVWELLAPRSGLFVGVALAATLLPPVRVAAGAMWFGRVGPSLWAPMAVATAFAVLVCAIWRKPAAALCALVLLELSVAGGFEGANYRVARPFWGHDNFDADQYRVALQFIQETPKLSEGAGNVVFWYNNRAENPINSVQSTYIWGNSRMNQPLPADPGMPHLGEFQMTQLQNPKTRYVILLGESPQEVQAGLQALQQARVGYDLLSTRDLHSGALHVYWQMVEITKRPK